MAITWSSGGNWLGLCQRTGRLSGGEMPAIDLCQRTGRLSGGKMPTVDLLCRVWLSSPNNIGPHPSSVTQ